MSRILTCTLVRWRDIEAATRLNQHLVTVVTEVTHQLEALFLDQRLATGYFDQAARVLSNLFKNLFDGHLGAATESIFAIAPGTSKVAPGEAHKDARPPRKR
jgi:hypothetical protein